MVESAIPSVPSRSARMKQPMPLRAFVARRQRPAMY